MMKFGLFGAGRIGKIHGGNIAARSDCMLAYVADPFQESAQELADQHGAKVVSIEEILADETIDAVIIASPTDTHADFIEASAKAGKDIFCEKPIDLDIKRVEQCLKTVKQCGVTLSLGFNRRFDPNFRQLKKQMDEGTIGKAEMVVITSRDPSPPPVEYIKKSGGLFRDMMIHDFDMAIWLLGEMPCEVMAYGSCLVDPEIGKAGDIDTAVVMLKTASGKIAQINNSRRSIYGYDQRIEVHGSEGALAAGNVKEHTVTHMGNQGLSTALPLHFFLERYMQAYQNELNDFIDAIKNNQQPLVHGIDGKNSLMLADAAWQSHETGKPVKI